MNVTKLYNALEAHSHLFDYFSLLKKDIDELYDEVQDLDFTPVHHRTARHFLISIEKFRQAVHSVEDDVRQKLVATEDRILHQPRRSHAVKGY